MPALILNILGVTACATGLIYSIIKNRGLTAFIFFIAALIFSAGIGIAAANL